jgi:hypothetical protein
VVAKTMLPFYRIGPGRMARLVVDVLQPVPQHPEVAIDQRWLLGVTEYL